MKAYDFSVRPIRTCAAGVRVSLNGAANHVKVGMGMFSLDATLWRVAVLSHCGTYPRLL